MATSCHLTEFESVERRVGLEHIFLGSCFVFDDLCVRDHILLRNDTRVSYSDRIFSLKNMADCSLV